MGKLGELFKMSKQERAGAWAIAIVIMLLLAAVFIERRCSSDVKMSPGNEKELNEYIDGAEKSAPKKSEKKKTKKSNTSKTASNTKSKSKSQSTNSTKKKSTKKQSSKTSKSTSTRKMDPVPQF